MESLATGYLPRASEELSTVVFSLTRMCFDVRCQVVLLGKAFVTASEAAMMWTLSSVASLVLKQGRGSRERLDTELAQVFKSHRDLEMQDFMACCSLEAGAPVCLERRSLSCLSDGRV